MTTTRTTTASSGGGMSLMSTLTVIFVVLKLVEVITWSWWWVFSPIWLTVLFVIGMVLLIGFFGSVGALLRVGDGHEKFFRR